MIKRPLPSGSGALLVLVVLIGINLRPFLTAIGPLAGEIDAQLALGMDRLAWVTLLPLLLIGVGVLLTPALIDKTGPRPLLGAALLLSAGPASARDPLDDALDLLTRDDPLTAKLRAACRFHVIPNMNPDGSVRGRSDDNIEAGITADEAAQQILDGMAAGRREIPVGRGPEMAMLDLLRADPDKIFDMMAAQGKTIATAEKLP